MAEATAAATGLETLEARHNPLARTGQAGSPGKSGRAGSRARGPWRMAASPVVHGALSNAFWQQQGLQSITERYHQLRSA